MKKYKIYRLVDPTMSPDSNKYIEWTNKTLSAILSNHLAYDLIGKCIGKYFTKKI